MRLKCLHRVPDSLLKPSSNLLVESNSNFVNLAVLANESTEAILKVFFGTKLSFEMILGKTRDAINP